MRPRFRYWLPIQYQASARFGSAATAASKAFTASSVFCAFISTSPRLYWPCASWGFTVAFSSSANASAPRSVAW